MFDMFKTPVGAQRLWLIAFLFAFIVETLEATSILEYFGRMLVFAVFYFICFSIHLSILSKLKKSDEQVALELRESHEYAMNKNKEELQKRIALDHVNDIEREELNQLLTSAGFAPAADVGERGPVIGRFMDEDIFEWVMLRDPFTGESDKFIFHSGLKSGNPVDLPEEENKTFALLGYVVYEKV